MARLSIVVPVYNVRPYLEECLSSVCSQTLADFEAIVVDDGSTDGSGELADSLCANDPRFRVVHKENGGLMSAWVRGVRETTAPLVGFVDSDDAVNHHMFEVLVAALESGGHDLAICGYERLTGDCEASISPPMPLYPFAEYAADGMDELRDMALPRPGRPALSMARWNKVFRRELLCDNLVYCSSLSRTFEDRYIVPACIYGASSACVTRAPLYYYRQREGSNSGMYKPELLSEIHRMYSVQRRMLEDKGLLERYRCNWEKAFIDYMRLYISRNVIGVGGFGRRLESCKALLRDKVAIDRMARYGAVAEGKQGTALRAAFGLRSPLLLAAASYLV